MSRALLRSIVHDRAGNVLQNALVNVYLKGTTTPVSDMFAAEAGGVAITTLTSNAQGEVVAWFDNPKFVDLEVTDNSDTAFYPSAPVNLLSFTAFTETVEVSPRPEETLTTAHESDPTGAHAASAISFSPVGTLASTNAQDAIAEAASEAAAGTHNHDAAYVNESDHTLSVHDILGLATQAELDAESAARAAHEADSTAVHGITDTALLATLDTAQTLTAKKILQGATSAAEVLGVRVAADTQDRIQIRSGEIRFGSGAVAPTLRISSPSSGRLALYQPAEHNEVVVNADAGFQAGFKWAKASDFVGKWFAYVPGNSNDLRFYSGTDRLTLGAGAGDVGLAQSLAAAQTAAARQVKNSAGTVLIEETAAGFLGIGVSPSFLIHALKNGAAAQILAQSDAVQMEQQAYGPGGYGVVGTRTNHQLEITVNATSAATLQTDANIANGETALLVRRNVGGSFSLQRVSMGAVDSESVGFRALRVPN